MKILPCLRSASSTGPAVSPERIYKFDVFAYADDATIDDGCVAAVEFETTNRFTDLATSVNHAHADAREFGEAWLVQLERKA
jgi:hypothetical protein